MTDTPKAGHPMLVVLGLEEEWREFLLEALRPPRRHELLFLDQVDSAFLAQVDSAALGEITSDCPFGLGLGKMELPGPSKTPGFWRQCKTVRNRDRWRKR